MFLKKIYYTILRRRVQIKQFGYTPLVLIQDGIVLLSWKVENAWQVTITPELGAVAAQASVQLVPKQEGAVTLTLTAQGYGGTVSEQLQLTILPLSILTPSVAYQQMPSVDSPQIAVDVQVKTQQIEVEASAIAFSKTKNRNEQPVPIPIFILLKKPQSNLSFHQNWIEAIKENPLQS
jgi:hypothetical protein